MEFSELMKRAKEIRGKYKKIELKVHGKSWTREQVAQGFVGDVGDLLKLVLAGFKSILSHLSQFF